MKILMIAPQPFFEPRGTPFSEYFRILALTELGHTVDLVTYPLGEDRQIPGLKIYRSPRVPGIRRVKTGPSPAKAVLDFFLFFSVLRRLWRAKYDLIHSHEEGCLMGLVASRLRHIPHLYDMHSSLSQQMDNFQFTTLRPVVAFFRWLERRALRQARSVIVICRSLYEYAATLTDPAKLTLIENFRDDSVDPKGLDAGRLEQVKSEINPDRKKVILYAGTFEPYQGLPLLVESLAHLPEEFRLVLVGGRGEQRDAISALAAAKGLADRVLLAGQRDPTAIPYYLQAADVLVSPRARGTNIPLKIYSYLASGVPLVATNLATHTQTLTPEIAILVSPEPSALAAGIREAAGEKGKQTAARAREFCRRNYSVARYNQLVRESLDRLNRPI